MRGLGIKMRGLGPNMRGLGINLWLLVLASLPTALSVPAQSPSCPVNSNFSDGTLLHWLAYTGNNSGGNDSNAVKLVYDSSQPAPFGTIGATALPEYELPDVKGIQVITYHGTDMFGGFDLIPTINGYAYHYSILLGSTSVTNHRPPDPANGQIVPQPGPRTGGYVRGIRYLINVPPGPPGSSYTMTYAYAMVLENGTHASEEQPMARAIISTPAGVIECASPAYFLPTFGGQLDSATARANGFTPSSVATPNSTFNAQGQDLYLQDVWTKGWTEVTFDLSPYRGQQVSLTFEADNCVPGGHFAYAYFAVRDNCDGLRMSGDTLLCSNGDASYYVPSLNGASYAWSAPYGWNIDSGGNGNAVRIKAGPQPGWVVATETNSCTSLTDSLFVHLYKGALPEAVIDPLDTTVCSGGVVPLHALVTTGTDFAWAGNGSFSGRRNGAISSVPFAANVIASPEQTTDYILTLHNEGCPVAVTDTFKVGVVPPIQVNPGDDTLVVIDQPLHLHATSSDLYRDDYQWSPSTDLSNPDISDPIGLYGSTMNNITYQVTATDSIGCSGTASLKVTIAHTLPDIFVPNAFTPGAGSNNLFRPVCMGISSLEFFHVYNRWGQLVFGTSQIGQGWDGRIQGHAQEPNTYLWIVKGTDYTGRVISKRGTMVLLR